MQILLQIYTVLQIRRDAYIDYWSRFRDACGDDAEMRQRIDAFFVVEIGKIEDKIAEIEKLIYDANG